MPRHSIALVVGSLRRHGLSRKLAEAIIASAPGRLDCRIVEIADLPLYDQDLDEQPPAPWRRFRDEIVSADGVLLVTPEYNRSIPAALKNAIDVGSRPYGKSVWSKKPAAIATVSPSSLGGFGCNHHLRQCAVFLDMPMMQQPEAYLGNVTDQKFGGDGSIQDEGLRKVVGSFAEAFGAWVDLIQRGRAALAANPEGSGAA
jgi:chromate reductase